MIHEEKSSKFIILEIKRTLVKGVGYCALVIANPIYEIINDRRILTSNFRPEENAETYRFLIPEQATFLHTVPYYAQNQIPWEPDFTVFTNDIIFDQISQNEIKAYIHSSFYEITCKPGQKSNSVDDMTDEELDAFNRAMDEEFGLYENDENAYIFKQLKTWPLIEFAKSHGKMQVGEFQNKVTGELFHSCIFTQLDGTSTFVAFDRMLGELVPKEIAAMKDDLFVVQLESGNFSLIKHMKDKVLSDGTKFNGKMINGKAEGLCFFYYPNGRSRKGYFHNGLLNGPGYLNEGYGMTVGFWKDGELNTWGIKYYNQKFTFGYWVNGELTKDFTSWTYWVRDMMGDRRLSYKGNLITVSKEEFGYIRFGIPGKKVMEGKYLPGNLGFEFHTNGILYVGESFSLSGTGLLMRFAVDSIEMGYFKNDILQTPHGLESLQSHEYDWHEDGLFATKELKSSQNSSHNNDDDLPF